MSIFAGSDTYGRVKNVGGTPVITSFAMLQFLPLYPLQSFYYLGSGKKETKGIPLLAAYESTEIHVIPLAEIDRKSVVMAYIRAVCATLAVLGFFGIIFSVIAYFGNQSPDRFALIATRILNTMFVVGVVGGLLTYLLSKASQRERTIRFTCGELLGICIDPAKVHIEMAHRFDGIATQVLGELNSNDPRLPVIQQLISARSLIAQGYEEAPLELQTDELLEQLDQLNR